MSRYAEEIAAVLAEDARQHPLHADARAAAVQGWVKAFDAAFPDFPDGAAEGPGAQRLLTSLHIYETHRGNGAEPSPIANWHAGVNDKYIAIYEAAR